jgi:Ferritin-like domain
MPTETTRPLPPSETVDRPTRRQVLAASGAGLTLAALVAACGGDDEEEATLPETGEPTPVQTLPETPVTDAVLLRTASSLVYNVIDSYARALEMGVLDGAERGVSDTFLQQQRVHADALATATEDAGGEPFDEPNPNFAEEVVDPAFELIEAGGNDPQDVLRFLHALETIAATNQQTIVPMLSRPELRQIAARIGGVDARQATVLSRFLDGTTVLAPELAPATVETTVAETTVPGGAAAAVPTPAAQVPSTFGSLTAVTVVLNGEELTINTPGPNSYIY